EQDGGQQRHQRQRVPERHQHPGARRRGEAPQRQEQDERPQGARHVQRDQASHRRAGADGVRVQLGERVPGGVARDQRPAQVGHHAGTRHHRGVHQPRLHRRDATGGHHHRPLHRDGAGRVQAARVGEDHQQAGRVVLQAGDRRRDGVRDRRVRQHPQGGRRGRAGPLPPDRGRL
ncbi:MAG: hypothetical protein AVDCRST_MAG89-5482, partial [uncultured Gemmatimonadetes bacterium]